jgi:pyruvate dehydrogenase E2 component (dihydrolipoamide acetyltransferase)
MARQFKLPDLGEGIHEGEILAVRVAVGQEVAEGDIILEVETDKAAVEIPSPYSGKVVEILVTPGDTVKVGQVLLVFSGAGEEAPAAEPGLARKASASGKTAPDAPPPPVPSAEGPAAAGPREGPVPASPATRRLARELKVDLAHVPASGPAGLVTADDVRAFAGTGKAREVSEAPAPAIAPAPAAGPPEAVVPDFSKWGPVERVAFRSVRRATARQMSLAWSQIPHVNSQELVDVTALEAFRQRHKKEVEALGGRLTMTVFAIKAATAALKSLPQVNASLDTAAGEIVLKKYFHIGVAVNTDVGLVVPVVREVDNKSIRELGVELEELIRRTRARKVTLEEMQGGTFTITNAGAMGGGFFAPIINHPQVAILGMGQARLQPAVRQDDGGPQIVPRLLMPVVLCIDHRVLDGADAVAFLQLFRKSMEDPDELLMSMI